MPKKKRFEFLDHTADVYIMAYGNSLREVFENAALATIDVITDTGKVEGRLQKNVEIEASDEQALLYAWIEELLVLLDAEEFLLSRSQISSIEEGKRGLRLKAKIWGEFFNPTKHPQKVVVKAITYHLMEIVTEAGKVTAKFLLDI